MNDSANGTVARPVPLFASSWAALFSVIRYSLTDRSDDSASSEPPPQR